MESKKIRDLIATLIIIAIGIKIITMIGLYYIPTLEVVGISLGILNSMIYLGNMFMLGMIALAIIIIPFYLSKRSDEKKQSKLEKRVQKTEKG